MPIRPKLVRYFLLATYIIMSGIPSPRAFAEIITTPTEIPPSIPLMITAYQAHLATATTDSKGKVLTQTLDRIDVLELYNSGNTPLDLRSWQIVDAADVTRVLQFSSPYQGYITPGQHVVLASVGFVSQPTYTIDGWNDIAARDTAVPGLKLIAPDYRIGQTDLKVSDVLEKRTYGVSSYLSTFVDAAPYGTPGIDAYLTTQLFDDRLYQVPLEPVGLEVSEVYSYASDCEPFDTSVLCGDYIELHNTSPVPVDLNDLVLRTDSNSSSRSISNTFTLSGFLAPNAYWTVHVTDDGSRIALTNSGGYVWLEDTWGFAVLTNMMTQWPAATGDQQGLARVLDAQHQWAWTTTPTPGSVNIVTAPVVIVAECTEGKYRNPETGRCRTIAEAVSELAACDEGYERNATTNRCRKVALATAGSTLTPCIEGYERNPITNRCRSIASAIAALMPCDEGQERNPTTNRCRKTQSSDMPSVPFAVEPVEATMPVWQWWVGGTVVAGLLGYGVWEWRHEIGQAVRRIIKR